MNLWRGLSKALSLHVTAHGKKHKDKREEHELQVGELQEANIVIVWLELRRRRGLRMGKMKLFSFEMRLMVYDSIGAQERIQG